MRLNDGRKGTISQIKTSFCLLGQWICQLYCSYIGLNSSSSCFSPFFWFVDSISPCAFTSPCLEIVPFLLDPLPAQKSRSYSATRVDMFGSHGHIMHFSTCRARVIRWPVGRKQSNQLTYFPNGGNSATAKSTGSGSSGTQSKSLTMAIKTLFGSRFQNAWIALPGRIEPFNSASYVVVANSSFPDREAWAIH